MQSMRDVILRSRLAAYAEGRASDADAGDAAAAGATAGATVPPTPSVCALCGETPICGGIGYMRRDVPVGHPQFGRSMRCPRREREDDNRKYEELQRLSNLRQFGTSAFSTFDPDVPGTREAYLGALQYNEGWEPPWLILSGACGCGKTHLAAAIANASLDRLTVLFAVVPDLLDTLRAAYAPNTETSFDDRFNAIREVGMLILDDLGTENTTDWAREKLYQIINYRMNEKLPLVVTTNNVRQDKTTGRYLFGGVDERIVSRLSDVRMVRHFHMGAEDYRQRQTGYTLPTARPPSRRY